MGARNDLVDLISDWLDRYGGDETKASKLADSIIVAGYRYCGNRLDMGERVLISEVLTRLSQDAALGHTNATVETDDGYEHCFSPELVNTLADRIKSHQVVIL